MKKKLVKIFAMWLTVFMVIATADFGYGKVDTAKVKTAKAKTSADIQNEINVAEEKQAELERRRKSLSKRIKNLEKDITNVEKYITNYDKELEEIDGKIAENRQNLRKCKRDLAGLEEELQRTETNKNNQYITMAKRIQYMYENEGNGYADIIFSSSSLSDILNNLEYIDRISDYDDNMFKLYVQVCDEIEADKTELEKKEAEYEAIRNSLRFEKKSINKLLKQKKAQVIKYQQNIKEGREDVKDYNQQIIDADDELDRLLEEQRIKIAEEEQSSGNSTSTTTGGNSASGFGWPLTIPARISSPFGPRNAPTKGASTFHKGIDLDVPTGTTVIASKGGKVITSTYSSSAGNYIAIYHGNGQYTYYMHCSKLLVSVGTSVKKGQVIAKSGNTGISTGAHLHFGIFLNGNYVNPALYVHA
ncbi:MAG: peptidoglycan DD-metalloendopeptidase family protein [Lachnospiraceae bacterium]|nr:peptidoglycan DD-metalloendopeptidase family protein [Lachnospiraceae bacterium]